MAFKPQIKKYSIILFFIVLACLLILGGFRGSIGSELAAIITPGSLTDSASSDEGANIPFSPIPGT